jgi:hypothetical protein
MKKVLSFLYFLLFFVVFSSGVRALELTKIGTTDLTGKGIGSTVSAYTYSTRSFTLYGNSNASSSVAIKIDDVTYTATANKLGAWSTYLSNLTYDNHVVGISSASQSSLNFTLTISSASALIPTATPTATKTVASSSSTLPASGALENTFLSAAFALFLIGFGMAVKYRD